MQMQKVLILGGGHGTQALSLIANQKIYFGTWDDGGNTGFLRILFPHCLPFGDLRSVVVACLKKQNKLEIANILSVRSDNINQLLFQYKRLTELLEDSDIEHFEDFLEKYYESKLNHLLKYSHTSVPEDNLGNLIFLYLYKMSGMEGVTQHLKIVLDVSIDIGYVFSIPVYLYGYYYDVEKKRLKILDSEADIDQWHHPVIKFFVRDAEANTPMLNNTFLEDIKKAQIIYLAPGSPENYLPAINQEFIVSAKVNKAKVVLLSQLFVGAKDQGLLQQINFLSTQIDNLEIWIPSIPSVRRMLEETNLLMSYAVQGKYIDIFFVSEYQKILQIYLNRWKVQSHQNALYMLLYKVYSKRTKQILNNPTFQVRPCIEVVQEADGWKHSPESILKAHTHLQNSVVARN